MKISEKYESFNEEKVETSKIDFKKLYNLYFFISFIIVLHHLKGKG